MKKKIIGVDFDDVLMDYHSALACYHNATYGSAYSRDNVDAFNLDRVWGVPLHEARRRVFEFYDTDTHHEARPVPGAVDAIAQLYDSHAIHVITSRPQHTHARVMEWLLKHFKTPFKEVHFMNEYHGEGPKRRKSDVCVDLGVEVFIDDSPVHASEVANQGITAFLYDAPWNRNEDVEGALRVHSWEEIAQKLL